MNEITIIKGNILTPRSKQEIRYLPSAFMAFNSNGKIMEVSIQDLRPQFKNAIFLDFEDKFILPGFVDVHNHLSQIGLEGIYKGELLEWLNSLIFPREKKLDDAEYAKRISERFFRELVSNGTTTTSTYVTSSKVATDIAFEIAAKSGVRAFIGNVLMDQNSPDYLIKNSDILMKESEELIEKWHGFDARLYYSITPRFAIACSFDLLKQAAALAKKFNLLIQTHLGENRNELKLVKKMFPDRKNYTDVYYEAGLLGENTTVAHCIYLDNEELEILQNTGTNVAHCPSSNRFLGSGLMRYREYEEKEIEVALGTDIAAGYNLSVLDEMKEAIETSKTFASLNENYDKKPISPETAFYLGTMGGAKVLGLSDTVGSLEKGKSADFITLDLDCFTSEEKLYSDPKHILSKIIYTSRTGLIKKVFIKGKELKEN